MNREYEFKIGQQVVTKDEDTGERITGEVTDTYRDGVFIQWEDISEPVKHERAEYYLMQLSRTNTIS